MRGEHDPELDPPPVRRPVRLGSDFRRFQRLVANPFLALAALVGWVIGLRRAYEARNLPVLLVLVASLGGVVFLLQYHCLDCGATGWLFRWKSHACPRSLARQRDGRPLRFRGPTPTTQLVLWGYALLIGTLLALVVLRADR
jgi:hypothetical protein